MEVLEFLPDGALVKLFREVPSLSSSPFAFTLSTRDGKTVILDFTGETIFIEGLNGIDQNKYFLVQAKEAGIHSYVSLDGAGHKVRNFVLQKSKLLR